ncbi:hypothetical protein E8E15_004432 [Penicillium rubens]|uniref:Zinc finger protein n=1 Tax=Penicillium chrysogenum TaxID=5076 RepID=A0A167PRK4_PENCH|nr:uncharacterized protein N7525_011253 [Penicillium rubens]KAF3015182.1 hypothetical protein E8E15_004432 [Penicillium rubens]KAJ5821969.1 hypothetical protein N7525_011253 [Penicillium rubens]KZN83708.1 Zinc finger protein [Penicillium chrysogenum]
MISSRIDDRSDNASLATRKRGPRITRACQLCRARKVRCDGQSPCSGCRPSGVACVYRTSESKRTRGPTRVRSGNPSETSVDRPFTTTYGIPPAVQVRHDPVKYKRLRELRAGIGVSNRDSGSFQFYGPSSHFCFVQRIHQRIKRRTNEALLTPQSNPIPDGVERWGLERFMFSVGVDDNNGKCQPDAYLSREMGDAFLNAYFEIIHPQVPVLVYSEIIGIWEGFWKTPSQLPSHDRRDLVYMALAIGARVSSSEGRQDAPLSEGWGDHFSRKASGSIKLFEDPSLHSTHFFLLKAVYAYQIMRANDAYLYLGHAARSATALGIHRAQVVEGANPTMHRLRLTFWTLYAQERSCSLYTGRPSAFRDELIDAPYPEDLTSLSLETDPGGTQYIQATTQCAMTRAKAIIGKIVDRILVDIYSSKNILNMSDLCRVHQTALECDLELENMTKTLPPYLHFFDDSLPIGDGWQEVQRVILGNHYYLVRMLMHRPALVFATFFNSKAEAQERAAGTMDIKESIDASISSARSIIDLNYDVFFRRYPGVKFDGSLATFLVSACVNLLYDVLDSDMTAQYARNTFTVVERGIQCLDQIQHVGPTTGKALSLDVMKVAKDALGSNQSLGDLDENMTSFFPWLQQPDPRFNQDSVPVLEHDSSASPSSNAIAPTTDAGEGYLESLIMAPEVNYIPHWLQAGFQPQDIPHALY